MAPKILIPRVPHLPVKMSWDDDGSGIGVTFGMYATLKSTVADEEASTTSLVALKARKTAGPPLGTRPADHPEVELSLEKKKYFL